MKCLPMWVGLKGAKVPFPRNRRELVGLLLSSGCVVVLEETVRIAQCTNATRGERRAAVGPSLCHSGAFSGDESLEIQSGNLVL